MKTKQRKTIPKTRGHRVEKKPYVPLRECTDAQQSGERKASDQKKNSEDQKREGDQSGLGGGRRENKEECAQVDCQGNTENSEQSIHPGPIQTLSALSEQAACDTAYETPLVEAEEIPFSK